MRCLKPLKAKVPLDQRLFQQYMSADPRVSSKPLCTVLMEELKTCIKRVKRARQWHRVNPLTRAFAEAFLIMKLKAVKSLDLLKVMVKTIRELKELLSKEFQLIKMGMEKAWQISLLASRWGHPRACEWRNDKGFLIYWGLTMSWLTKLFGGVTPP